MILSKAHRFIFIKGRKVGGTSVEIALSGLCGEDDIVTPITPIDELTRLRSGKGARNYADSRATEESFVAQIRTTPRSKLAEIRLPAAAYTNHMPLTDVLARQGDACADYRVIAVERSPYAKILSYVNHMLSARDYKTGGIMRADPDQIRHRLSEIAETGAIARTRNIDLYRDVEGKMRARIVHLERLEQELLAVLDELGLGGRPLTIPHAKKGILADRLDMREYFDRRRLDIVNTVYREEFECFGYRML